MRKSRYKRKKIEFKIVPKFWLPLLSFLVIVSFLLSLVAILYFSPVFRVKTVDANVNLGGSIKRSVYGRSLFAVKLKKIRASIIKNNPEYKEVRILKIFPSALKIEAEKRKPFVQWKGKGFFLLDKEGVVLSTGKRNPFPGLVIIEVTNYAFPLQKGGRVKDFRLKEAFSLLEELARNNFTERFPVKLINPTKLEALYFIIENTRVIIGAGNLARKLSLLDNLLSGELKGDFSSVKYIDLRQSKVYLGYRR